MFKEFIKDYSFRLFRTLLQGFFLMLATNYGQNFNFTEGNAEQATGAVMLLATMGWTAFDAWRNSRSRCSAISPARSRRQPERAEPPPSQ